MGDDFENRNAHENFKNLDKLIHYVNLAVSLEHISELFYWKIYL